MRDKILLDIPIYRSTEDVHYDWVEKQTQPYVDAALKRGEGEDDARRMAQRILGPHPWDFNQVVGWVRIIQDGDSIKGYLYWTTAERISPRRDCHRYQEKWKVLELWTADEPNEAIAAQLIEEIDVVEREDPIKGRYMDRRVFDLLCPNIDWRTVLGIG